MACAIEIYGEFHNDISEAKMRDCLTALGNDVEIRVKPIRRRKTPEKINVVYAA